MTERDTSRDLSVREVLIQLAGLPPAPATPYLTVSLDWRPDGSDPGRAPVPDLRRSEGRSVQSDHGPSRRPSRDQAEREFAAILGAHGPRGDAFTSLTADIARVNDYLDNELEASAQGVFIVACSALGVFEALALGLPVPTRVVVDPIAALSDLARLDDDHPTYAVLLADQHDAQLSFISQATHGHSLSLRSTDYYRITPKQGGWDQRRFHGRTDERVNAFARGIAEETHGAMNELGVDMLVIAGDEIITSALSEAFHASLHERVIGTIRLDIRATDQEIIAATLPLVEQAERQREVEAVQQLASGFGAAERATAGVERTLVALIGGQVSTLIMNADLEITGWADYEFSLFGTGAIPDVHPAGGEHANIVAAAIEEELIRIAFRTGASVQIVKTDTPIRASELIEIPNAGEELPRSAPAAELDAMGGVGALLRFN